MYDRQRLKGPHYIQEEPNLKTIWALKNLNIYISMIRRLQTGPLSFYLLLIHKA